MCLMAGVSGTVWGGPMIFGGLWATSDQFTLLAMLTGGMMGAAIISYGPLPRVALSYMIPLCRDSGARGRRRNEAGRANRRKLGCDGGWASCGGTAPVRMLQACLAEPHAFTRIYTAPMESSLIRFALAGGTG